MVHFNFDDILKETGELGRYQIILYTLIGFVGLPCAWQNLAMVFIGGDMDYWCADTDNIDGAPPWSDNYPSYYRNLSLFSNTSEFPPSKCTKIVYTGAGQWNTSLPFVFNSSDFATQKCHSWVYDRSKYESSIISQFNLVCDEEWKVPTATSIYMLGFLIGTLFFGALSDRFGRHKIMMFCLVMLVVFGVAGAFAPEYISFVILRLMVGLCSAGSFTIGFVIIMETIGPTKRMSPGIFYQGWFALGIMAQAGMAYGVRNHVYFQLALALPGALFLSYWWLVPESPRWLVFHGRTKEAETLVNKMAKRNGRPEVHLRELLKQKQANVADESEVRAKPTLIDILKAPVMRTRTFNVCFQWFVVSMVYYALSLGSGTLGGNVYINHFLSGAVEIPSYLLTICTIDRFGRKRVMMVIHLFGGLSCLACTPLLGLKDLHPLLVTFAMLGKFAVAANFALIYVYSAEIFPTVVRNVGVGTGSMCARIGSLLAPQIARLDSVWRPLPFLLYGGIPLIACFLVVFLPETLHQKLPETMEDGEKFGIAKTYEAEIAGTEMEDKPLETRT